MMFPKNYYNQFLSKLVGAKKVTIQQEKHGILCTDVRLEHKTHKKHLFL